MTELTAKFFSDNHVLPLQVVKMIAKAMGLQPDIWEPWVHCLRDVDSSDSVLGFRKRM